MAFLFPVREFIGAMPNKAAEFLTSLLFAKGDDGGAEYRTEIKSIEFKQSFGIRNQGRLSNCVENES